MNTLKSGKWYVVSGKPWKQVLFAVALTTYNLSLITPQTWAASSNAGTKAGTFLKIATDAKGVALGANMVTMSKGSEGLRWNPAALGLTDSKEVAATHIEYYQDVTIEHISAARPLSEGAIGASLFYLNSGDLEGRTDVGLRTGDFKVTDFVGTVGYGIRARSREEVGMDIYLGAAVKAVQETIAEDKFKNAAADFGLILDPSDKLRIGVAARNLSTSKADFPKELTGGASYTMLKVITAAVAVKYTDDAPIRVAFAGEYRMPELENSVIRAGYTTHDEIDDSLDAKISAFRNASIAGLSFGGGMEYRPPQFQTLQLGIDYGMAPFGALGISHTLTLKVRW